MKAEKVITWLAALSATLTLVAILATTFWPVQPGPQSFTSVYGEVVQLYGQGLYRHNTVFFAASFVGQDIVTAVIAVPLLAIAAAAISLGAGLGWALLRFSAFTFLAYAYASLALGAFYNELFLLYVAIYAASGFGVALSAASLWRTLRDNWPALGPLLPRASLAVLLTVSGAVTLVLWAQPIVSAVLTGSAPTLLAHATTKVTEALDLGIIVPACFVAAALVWRHRPEGYVIAACLLGLIAMLLPVIAVSTGVQILAGVTFTPTQLIGPIGGFLCFGAFAVMLLWRMAKAASRLDRHIEIALARSA